MAMNGCVTMYSMQGYVWLCMCGYVCMAMNGCMAMYSMYGYVQYARLCMYGYVQYARLCMAINIRRTYVDQVKAWTTVKA